MHNVTVDPSRMTALTWSRAVSSLVRPLGHPVEAWLSGGGLGDWPTMGKPRSFLLCFVRGDLAAKVLCPGSLSPFGLFRGVAQQASGRRVALGPRVGPPLYPGQAGAGLCFLPQNFLGGAPNPAYLKQVVFPISRKTSGSTEKNNGQNPSHTAVTNAIELLRGQNEQKI